MIKMNKDVVYIPRGAAIKAVDKFRSHNHQVVLWFAVSRVPDDFSMLFIQAIKETLISISANWKL